mgnify:CR=1 FL=1
MTQERKNAIVDDIMLHRKRRQIPDASQSKKEE